MIILFLIISGLLYFTDSYSNLKYKPYIVSSSSMSPNLGKGSLALVVESDQFSVGDIVTFKSPVDRSGYITHRIVGKNIEEELFYKTKGDNNFTEDPWQITSDMLVGRVMVSIPYIGYPILFLKSSKIYLFILAGLLLLFSYVEISAISNEIIVMWKRKNQFKIYRKLRRLIDRSDKLLARYHVRN